MGPYIALISIPAIIDVLNRRFTFTVTIGEKKREARYFNGIVAFFVVLFIMLTLRDVVCGRDLQTYNRVFNGFRSMDLHELMNSGLMEPGYRLLNWIVGQFTSNFQWLLATVALLSLVPWAIFYNKESDMPYLTVILFCTVTPFAMFFSGIREGMTLGFTIPALLFTRKKKLLPFLITVLIAGFFHRSAYVLILLYPAYHMKFKQYWLLAFVPLLLLVLTFRHQFIEVVFLVLPSTYRERYAALTESSSYSLLALFFAFLIYAWIIPDPEKADNDILGMRNIMVITTAIQCFAPVHAIAERYGYYFTMLIPIMIPKVIKNAAPRFRKVANTSAWVMSIFFTSLFFWYLYVRRPLECYPYVPFWR